MNLILLLATRSTMIAESIDAALKAQTPPSGSITDPFYRCPACPQKHERRDQMRAHMTDCPAFAQRFGRERSRRIES